MPYRHFLGYRKGADGLPEIVPEEAELVRRIYRLFMQGKTPHAIGIILTTEGIPILAGKEKWQSSTIESILQNEKYRGDARLQKKFTVDFLQKKMKVNEGEVHSTMWRTAILLSLSRRNGTWYKLNSPDERLWAVGTVQAACFHP